MKQSSFKIPYTSQCVGSRDLLFPMVADAAEQASQAPKMQTAAVFCDVQGRPHSLARPSYRMYVCMPVYICICLTLDHSDFDVLVKIISIVHWNFPLKGYCQYNKLLTKASAS